MIAALFDEVALLRRHRIAHRDLRRANVFVDADGRTWLVDFGFAELAVDDGMLDADVAQVLAALAIVAGPSRPVTVAIDVLGRDVVASALPRLQLQALSGATRSALKRTRACWPTCSTRCSARPASPRFASSSSSASTRRWS